MYVCVCVTVCVCVQISQASQASQAAAIVGNNRAPLLLFIIIIFHFGLLYLSLLLSLSLYLSLLLFSVDESAKETSYAVSTNVIKHVVDGKKKNEYTKKTNKK